MRFDPDRLKVLAGVESHTEYMVDQLVSDLPSDEVEVETLPGMAAGSSSVPAGPGAPEAPAAESMEDASPAAEVEPEIEEPLEERLRRIIRNEVRHIVSEEISKRDDQQIQLAREKKSVAHAMGFASNPTGKTPSNQKKWTPTLSFAGPGFKR